MPRTRLDIVVPMYRDAPKAIEVVEALLACELPPSVTARIHVVDDGSGDDTPEQILTRFGEQIDLHRLDRNLGRSAARNAGAKRQETDLLLFLDGDCVPEGTAFLAHHLEAVRDADVSMGRVDGQDDGFWHEYQRLARIRRERLATRMPLALFTTQNVLIAAKLFHAAGGFDEGYRGYGFEDRDLALRLAEAGARFASANDAKVIHRDTLKLSGVCQKMQEAGRLTSKRFATRHPDEYRLLGYAAIDAELHPWRGYVATLAWPLLGRLVRQERWLQTAWSPFAIKAGLVRVMVALSYLKGTRERP